MEQIWSNLLKEEESIEVPEWHLKELEETRGAAFQIHQRIGWPKRNGKGQHLDPTDRAIFAAAMLHNLTVVSADKEMHVYGPAVGVSLLW